MLSVYSLETFEKAFEIAEKSASLMQIGAV